MIKPRGIIPRGSFYFIMITQEAYNKFLRYYNENSTLRFGQAFFIYFKVMNSDPELFYCTNRGICEQIIEQRYLHPHEQ